MNLSSVVIALQKDCKRAGSLRQWAKDNGFSPAYVSDVVNGNRQPSDRILNALGFVRIDRDPYYQRVESVRP